MRPVGPESLHSDCVLVVGVSRPKLAAVFLTVMLISLFLTFHVLYDSAVYSIQVRILIVCTACTKSIEFSLYRLIYRPLQLSPKIEYLYWRIVFLPLAFYIIQSFYPIAYTSQKPADDFHRYIHHWRLVIHIGIFIACPILISNF